MKSYQKLIIVLCSISLPPAALSNQVVGWGDSFTSGAEGSWIKQFETLSGVNTISRGVGGQTSTQVATRFFAEPSLRGEFTVIWVGRNNYSDPNRIKSDIARMVSSLTTQNYLILGITNGDFGGYESIGAAGIGYKFITGINNDLKAIYGSHFIDIRRILVNAHNSRLLKDKSDFARDIVPSSLRVDNIHLNAAGNKIVANNIFTAYTTMNITTQSVPMPDAMNWLFGCCLSVILLLTARKRKRLTSY